MIIWDFFFISWFFFHGLLTIVVLIQDLNILISHCRRSRSLTQEAIDSDRITLGSIYREEISSDSEDSDFEDSDLEDSDEENDLDLDEEDDDQKIDQALSQIQKEKKKYAKIQESSSTDQTIKGLINTSERIRERLLAQNGDSQRIEVINRLFNVLNDTVATAVAEVEDEIIHSMKNNRSSK